MEVKKLPTLPTLMKKKQVAAYARVSTGKDAMLHSLSAQISYYSAYIQKRPEWLYCGVYVDEAITGTKSERPEFQRLLSDCRAGKIDMVITKSISRFARNTVTLLETVRELKALGVDVFFEEPNIHTMSAAGEMMLTLLASVAQEESRMTSERMKWRVRKNFEEGVPWNVTILGYTLRNGRFVIVPEEAAIVHAESYQHREPEYYDVNAMSAATRQAVLLLASHFYESRDGSTGGFFSDRPDAGTQVWNTVHALLDMGKDWVV